MTIYVSGYPKSGTTWLTRLLGEILDRPTGASVPKLDSTEPASEGSDRDYPYFVRKGHFVFIDTPYESLVPRAHVINLKKITKRNVVFIYRDPRDIAVSAAFYFGKSVDETVDNLIRGKDNFRHTGPWDEYVEKWLQVASVKKFPVVSYEDLLSKPMLVLPTVIDCVNYNVEVSPDKIKSAIDAQSFNRKKQHIQNHGNTYPLGLELNLKLLRKGVAGDWKNHFTVASAFALEARFGSLLERLGYEYNRNWWKVFR